MNPHFILYTKTFCPWCALAKNYLDENSYHYKEIDVRKDHAAFEELKRISGQTKAPTLVVDDLVLADFGPEELVAFLQKHQL
jgi:glutaredoxin 3